jgi:hypothetical protein
METVLPAAVLLLDQLGEGRQAMAPIPGAPELAAVVGLDHQRAEIDAAAVAGESAEVLDVDLHQTERGPLDLLPGQAAGRRARFLAPPAAAVPAQDAPDGAGRAGQAELLFEPLGAETGDRVPRLEDLLLDLGGVVCGVCGMRP